MPSFTFYRTDTFYSGDLGPDIGPQRRELTVLQLGKLCNDTAGCVAFTNSGWLKSAVQLELNRTLGLPCDGVFIKGALLAEEGGGGKQGGRRHRLHWGWGMCSGAAWAQCSPGAGWVPPHDSLACTLPATAAGALKCGLLERGVALSGGDLMTCFENPGGACVYQGVASPLACCDLCQRTPGCGAFNIKLVASSIGACWLKAATGWRREYTDYSREYMLGSVLPTPGELRAYALPCQQPEAPYVR